MNEKKWDIVKNCRVVKHCWSFFWGTTAVIVECEGWYVWKIHISELSHLKVKIEKDFPIWYIIPEAVVLEQYMGQNSLSVKQAISHPATRLPFKVWDVIKCECIERTDYWYIFSTLWTEIKPRVNIENCIMRFNIWHINKCNIPVWTERDMKVKSIENGNVLLEYWFDYDEDYTFEIMKNYIINRSNNNRGVVTDHIWKDFVERHNVLKWIPMKSKLWKFCYNNWIHIKYDSHSLYHVGDRLERIL